MQITGWFWIMQHLRDYVVQIQDQMIELRLNYAHPLGTEYFGNKYMNLRIVKKFLTMWPNSVQCWCVFSFIQLLKQPRVIDRYINLESQLTYGLSWHTPQISRAVQHVILIELIRTNQWLAPGQQLCTSLCTELNSVWTASVSLLKIPYFWIVNTSPLLCVKSLCTPHKYRFITWSNTIITIAGYVICIYVKRTWTCMDTRMCAHVRTHTHTHKHTHTHTHTHKIVTLWLLNYFNRIWQIANKQTNNQKYRGLIYVLHDETLQTTVVHNW